MIHDGVVSGTDAAAWVARWILAERDSVDRPFVVGITGIDAAGKTTLATGVCGQLEELGSSVQLIQVDDFHRSKSQRYDERYSPPDQYLRLSIDFDRLRASLLEPIVSEHRLDTRLELLDLDTDAWTLSRTYRVTPSTVVVVEGVFLLASHIRDYFDRIVFLDCSEETALARARVRDRQQHGATLEERYASKYFPAQRRYLRANPPDRHASVVLHVTDDGDWLISPSSARR